MLTDLVGPVIMIVLFLAEAHKDSIGPNPQHLGRCKHKSITQNLSKIHHAQCDAVNGKSASASLYLRQNIPQYQELPHKALQNNHCVDRLKSGSWLYKNIDCNATRRSIWWLTVL